jgi:hypothetical protein
MAKLDIDGNELVLRLSSTEKLGAMHGDVRVPLTSIRGVRVVQDPWTERRGIRAPGTGWPGRVALGTWRGSFGRDFRAVFRHGPAVVVELEGAEFQRLVVSDDDAEATAARLSGQVAGPAS